MNIIDYKTAKKIVPAVTLGLDLVSNSMANFEEFVLNGFWTIPAAALDNFSKEEKVLIATLSPEEYDLYDEWLREILRAKGWAIQPLDDGSCHIIPYYEGVYDEIVDGATEAPAEEVTFFNPGDDL